MTDRPEPPHPLPLPSGEREESGRLAQNIVYFARALRAAGIPVGPGSVLDALNRRIGEVLRKIDEVD